MTTAAYPHRNAYAVAADGTLSPVTLPIVDGETCTPAGYPLRRTDEIRELKGWAFGRARVYLNDADRVYLVQEGCP